MSMTYEQATEQAITLRKQGLSFPAIQEHLKKAGYVSPHSKGPVTHMAIRAMVTRASKPKDGTGVDAVINGPLSAPKADLLQVIKALASAEGLSVDLRLQAIQRMVKSAETF